MNIKIIETKSAKGFLNAISLDSKRHDRFFSKFIFRGQADSEWEIIPSAFRENTILFRDDKVPRKFSERTNRDQIEAEYYMLHRFCNELQRSGLYIPNEQILSLHDYQHGFFEFHNKIGRSELPWPSQNYLSIIALAQHYGLPTRFIDWSLDPLVAAYFAVKSWINLPQDQKPEYISVYALDTILARVREYGFDKHIEDDLDNQKPNNFYQLVRSPSFFNEHLKAQKGVFLAYIQRRFKPNSRAKAFSLDSYINENSSTLSNQSTFKYILHKKHYPSLFKLLQNRSYTASNMFPGIAGCISSVYESIE